MNSDQMKKAREMIFGIHVHIIQGSIHAKFQDPASWMILTNGKNFSPKKWRNFQEGPGGQISFKMSQEPKTSEKKYWTEVGHGSQGLDLTNV